MIKHHTAHSGTPTICLLGGYHQDAGQNHGHLKPAWGWPVCVQDGLGIWRRKEALARGRFWPAASVLHHVRLLLGQLASVTDRETQTERMTEGYATLNKHKLTSAVLSLLPDAVGLAMVH